MAKPNKNHKLLLQAFSLFQNGNLDDAKSICEDVLKTDPNSVDANHLYGVILLHKKFFKESLPFFERALRNDDKHAKIWSNQSLALSGLERLDDALASVDRAIKLDPSLMEALYNKANILLKVDRTNEALELLDIYIQANPKNYFVRFIRANALRKIDQFELAIEEYHRIIALKPDFIEALLNLGLSLSDTGNYEESLDYFNKVLLIKDDFSECHINKGATLERMGLYQEAYQCFLDALRINPNSIDALLNCGITLEKLGRLEESIQFYDQLIELDHANQAAYFNRGYVLEKLQRLDESIKNYDKAIELEPSKSDTYWNRSLVLLCKGDYERGWAEYENRLKLKMAESHYLTNRLQGLAWNGSPAAIKDKVLLVRSEQGMGDTIQFCRYVKYLAKMGAKVILQVQKPLYQLLQDLEGVGLLIHEGHPLPVFDLYCNLMSLPFLLRTTIETIPSEIPYLKASPDKVREWDERLGPRINGVKRVGLVWSGGFRPDRPDLWLLNKRRNIELSKLKGFRTEGIEFHSLQKGELPEAELVVLYLQSWDGPNIVNHADQLTDFTETAALLENLDLLISVDTSTAHLAGALGKPVWLMNRFDTCWRWFLDRDDSPWYPSFRIFRQKGYDDWSAVIEEVERALRVFAKN